jgi:hypothetical protein
MFKISKQTINSWTSERRKIPDKYKEILSEQFKIPKEYFSKQLDEIDKIKIQKIKLQNEIEPFEVDKTEHYDSSELLQLDLINYKINQKELLVKIKNSLDKCLETKDNNCVVDELENGISKVRELISYYNSFTNLLTRSKEDRPILRDILKALELHYGNKSIDSTFMQEIIAAVKKQEEWLNSKNWGSQE